MSSAEGGPGEPVATKPLLGSRAFWATWSPVVAVALGASGAGEAVFGQIEIVIEGLLTAFGGAMWLWHHFVPDPRVPTVGG